MWCKQTYETLSASRFANLSTENGARSKPAGRPVTTRPMTVRRDGRQQNPIAKMPSCHEIACNSGLSKNRKAVGRPWTQARPVFEHARLFERR